MANDNVMCLSCMKLVPEDSQAMQCDLCHRWAHIGCVGVTKAAYKLAGKLEGFQWLCPRCLDDWRSTKPLVLDLASEIKMLQIEASKVPALENTLRELQSTVEKLSGVIDFMTSESSSASLPSLPVNLDPCIKESPNRFALLQDLEDSSGNAETTIDHPIPQENLPTHPSNSPISNDPLHSKTIPKALCLSSNDSHQTNPQPFNLQTQSTPCNHAQHASQSLPASQILSPSNQSNQEHPPLKQIVVYLRNIPSQLSMQALKNTMAKEGVNLEGCTLTSTQGNSTLIGSKKCVKVSCDSLDRCNSLDRELKSNPHLPWFLSLYPPRKPHRGPQNRDMLNSHSQPNVPSLSSNQPFLSKRPPPLMDILLPPLKNRPPIFLTPPNMQPTTSSPLPTKSIIPLKSVKNPTPYKIPPLMSLQLPPLATQTCPPPHPSQQVQIALR